MCWTKACAKVHDFYVDMFLDHFFWFDIEGFSSGINATFASFVLKGEEDILWLPRSWSAWRWWGWFRMSEIRSERNEKWWASGIRFEVSEPESGPWRGGSTPLWEGGPGARGGPGLWVGWSRNRVKFQKMIYSSFLHKCTKKKIFPQVEVWIWRLNHGGKTIGFLWQ